MVSAVAADPCKSKNVAFLCDAPRDKNPTDKKNQLPCNLHILGIGNLKLELVQT